MPSASPVFMELDTNLSAHAFNTTFMRSGLLKKDFMLVFLFMKINIAPSFAIIELYLIDVVLMNMILQRQLFDVASIMYTSIL